MNKLSILIIGIISVFLLSCSTLPDISNRNFRQDMRDFVIRISETARISNSSFIIIPQNGQEIISLTNKPEGPLATEFISAINGTGREDLYFGYVEDNLSTPSIETEYMRSYLDIFESEGLEVLTTDYCSTPENITNSYSQNELNNFISFAATERTLNIIPGAPAPYNNNSDDILNLSLAKNFLYLINSENYLTKQNFIDDVSDTNFDVIIMDLYHNEEIYTFTEVTSLKTKNNGKSRLVLCYMSIGEAEDYRFYWDNSWKTGNPIWLDHENPGWEGNYKVRYWEDNWQDIILTGADSYLGKILAAGFDGVYLDIIDGFDYFENY
jgi:cysteinyl-tRNA synthetase, unknown class